MFHRIISLSRVPAKHLVWGFVAVFLWLACVSIVSPVQAQEVGPCKAGVHVLSPSDDDFRNAALLVNSNGGRNCWLTIVLREDEMKIENLQRIHNLAREYDVRLVHRIEKGFTPSGQWLMPTVQTVQKFIRTLNGITPYAKTIYVVLGNEPTHGAMCGSCTPESFAKWSMQALELLDEASDEHEYDIVAGLAGQDLASPQAPGQGYYDAEVFMAGMFKAEPDLICNIDVWISHSYPNSFVGSPFDVGRRSPRGYEWELDFLQRNEPASCPGHVKSLPVLITETGYKIGGGGVSDEAGYSGTASIIRMYESDPRIIGYTFFAFTYCGEPFDSFALIPCSTQIHNGEFASLRGSGRALYEAPKKHENIDHIRKARTIVVCPEKLIEQQDAECIITATNTGTDIWENIDGTYGLRLIGAGADIQHEFTQFRAIKPGETLSAKLAINPGTEIGTHEWTIGLTENGLLQLALAQWQAIVDEQPTMVAEVQSLFGTELSDQEGQIQIFDENSDIVFRKKGAIVDGVLSVGKVSGVTFGTCFRVVLLVDQSLPVQKECIQFTEGENIVEMPRMLPVDRNSDGKLTLSDVMNRFTL